MARVLIDPVTGIEGHLRIEAQVEGAEVTDVWSSSSRFQGIELLLRGQDPREAWSFAQRICGGCARSHALCSVRAVENALQIQIPANARLVRNISTATQHIQDHVLHFYHSHALDWVDASGALDADPILTSRLAQSVSDWPLSSPDYFSAVKTRLATFFQSTWTDMPGRAYGHHAAYRLPPEANLMVMAHYLQALDWQRDISRIQSLCGNPGPHLQTYRVGGVACPMDPDNPSALNAGRLAQAGQLFASVRDFVEKVYLRDLVTVASFYRDWAGHGGGPGNYAVYGDFPLTSGRGSDDPGPLFLPGGMILGKDLDQVHPIDRKMLAQQISRSWLEAGSENTARSRSWLGTPRYDGTAVEVGPLARMLIAYASAHERVGFWVDAMLGELEMGRDALLSTLGRTMARGIEATVLAEKVTGWLDELAVNLSEGNLHLHNMAHGAPATWPREAIGFGWAEAPHGALSHGVHIEEGTIAHYQCLVPSAWNTSPRDAGGQRGACEAALLSTPVADPARPLEILRTVHSFDPCTAWAVHTTDLTRREIGKARAGCTEAGHLEDGGPPGD